jgi:molecular chaperone GrpE (heat shock protein)
LHTGAARSGQPRLVEQLTHFQNACRDAARRVGLSPFAADTGEPFDAQRHKSAEAEAPPAGAKIVEYLAPGYTLQGRLIRPALVRVSADGPTETAPAKSPAASADQDQLPLESPGPA